MKKILVVGATGMLGKAVARQLKKDGYHVRIMSRNIEKAKELFDSTFEFYKANVTDRFMLDKAIDGCDGIYISLSGDDIPTGVKNITEVAIEKGIERIGFISGSSVREENPAEANQMLRAPQTTVEEFSNMGL